MNNTRASKLLQRRIVFHADAFAEMVIWMLPSPLPGSRHRLKYRLAYVVSGVCVLRYDNEAGKGDHRHWGDHEAGYRLSTPEQLLADFMADIDRWNHDNRDL